MKQKITSSLRSNLSAILDTYYNTSKDQLLLEPQSSIFPKHLENTNHPD